MEKRLGIPFLLVYMPLHLRFYIGSELEITSTDIDFAKEVYIKQFSNFVDRPVGVQLIEQRIF